MKGKKRTRKKEKKKRRWKKKEYEDDEDEVGIYTPKKITTRKERRNEVKELLKGEPVDEYEGKSWGNNLKLLLYLKFTFSFFTSSLIDNS